MEKEERLLLAKEIGDYLIKKGFTHKQKRTKEVLEQAKAEKVVRRGDVFPKNEKTLEQWISQGIFKKAEYDYPEEGPYDYRYLIDHGVKLNPSKAMLALYWKEKSSYTKLGKQYSFPTRGMASAMMRREMRDAAVLATAIEFKEFSKLVELVDDKYQEMFKTRGGFEWKLKNLLENVDLLIQ